MASSSLTFTQRRNAAQHNQSTGCPLSIGRVALLLCVLVGCSGCADYLPFSGGSLEGSVVVAPASWTEIAQAEIVQLETNPADPYSVNLWVIGEGLRLYVFAGATRTNWVEDIEVDPNVRLRFDNDIYELTASRVTDAAEFEWFAQAWETKYGNRPRNESVSETWLMRLATR